ncbi:tetratricopeptide repeat protein [Roseibium sp. SCP14]|uniref:tetratricopeptide repeat protein n=1 Tax=Roseibium sp. SCP14 TaxID=3141375 RepID=UPI00333D5D34
MLLVDDRLKAAREHAAAGRHDNAALLFESILDVSPGHGEALCGLIEAQLAKGQLETAQALLKKATAASGRDPGFLTLAAKIALLSENGSEAERLTERALAIDPYFVEAALLKADFLASSGALSDLEDLLNSVRVRNPDPHILLGISKLYYSHGLLGPALTVAQEALSLKPESADLNILVGQILSALGDHGKAEPFLETAHLQDPANPEILLALANNAAATGQLTEAVRFADRAKILFPDLMPAWLSYIRIKANRGEAIEALREFAPVAKAAKNRMDATLTLGAAYRLAGEPEKTLQLLEPLLASAPQLDEPVRLQLFSILRDAFLSTGQLEKVATIPDTFLTTNLQLSEDAMADHEALANRLRSAALVIDPKLSNLEFMVMARFFGELGRGFDTPVVGTSALSQLAQLFGYENYLPNDAHETSGKPFEFSHAFPVSQVLAVPATLRGGLTGKVPYLPIREDLHQRWHDALSEFPRPWIGLAWNESPPGLTLDTLLPSLPPMPGTLISTIWDHSREQLAGHKGIIDAGRHIRRLDDLAALLHALDFVIGPDGIVLHAAGAANTPGLALVSHMTPWYWHARDGRSLWYPDMDVVRAPRFGHWATLMPELAEEIEGRINDRF